MEIKCVEYEDLLESQVSANFFFKIKFLNIILFLVGKKEAKMD